MPLASLTSSVTSAVATHGLWAVFALMLVDAVFPVASELVMVTRARSPPARLSAFD
jgi:hypothetical protein